MPLETTRLTLQPMEATDVEPIHRIANQPGVRHFLFDDKYVSQEFIREIHEQSVTNFKSRAFGVWILREKVVDLAIGFCGLRVVAELDEVELLYALSETKWHYVAAGLNAGIRPGVGLSVATPLANAGNRSEPPMSLP